MGELVPNKDTERIPDQGSLIQVGQWYWITTDWYQRKPFDFFSCVTHIGSNFIEFTGVGGGNVRIHINDFEKKCKPEPNPEKYIQDCQAHYQKEVQNKLGEIKEITARLGLLAQSKIEQPAETSSRSLSVLSNTLDVKKYKKSLIQAKEKELPKLFEEVKQANEQLVLWMKARSLPMQAMAGGMKDCIEQIDDRIFNVSLYAGLTEITEKIADGEPAGPTEKLRILQRLLYMDEECLLGYKHGGMEFDDIRQFDKWLAKPENRNRVFPFPRCVVAFRVRREGKDRDWAGDIGKMLVNIELEELDKATFLYIRNGDQLYRMGCDLQFGELIFPSKEEFDLSEPMMAKMFGGSVDRILPKREYDVIKKEQKEIEARMEAWTKANPGKHSIHMPYEISRGHHSFSDKYEPFNKSSVYYDEIKEEIDDRVKQYNRIALIVQGLYDRSEILHPHPPVCLWKPEGFVAAVELIYDGSNLLHYGDAPDFEVYQRACNATLKEGSVTIGQDGYWQEVEAVRENNRRHNSWRDQDRRDVERFKPYGNPGPGYAAKITKWHPRTRKATFEWERERLSYWRWGQPEGPVKASVTVPESRLFNVDAYKPGDYKRFFVDPRTRAHYLKWAPMLLAAEEYHAGNLKLGAKPRE